MFSSSSPEVSFAPCFAFFPFPLVSQLLMDDLEDRERRGVVLEEGLGGEDVCEPSTGTAR